VPTTTSFLIDVDGTALAPDMVPMLAAAYVDDSLHLPDVFELRFRDPDRTVLARTGFKVGSAVKVSVLTGDSAAPEQLLSGEVTTLEAEFDAGGTFTIVRGYDRAHRLFRGRRTESYKQVTASDIVKKVAQRAQLKLGTIESTSTVYDHMSQSGQTDWQFLEGLAKDIGYQLTVRDGKLDFGKARTAADAPQPSGAADQNPLVLKLGTDLLRFRTTVTSAEQVKEVQVRGWDVAQKRALVATAPAKTTSAVLADVTPATLAHVFGDPVYVATDVPYRTQAEVDAAAGALAEQIAGAFAEFEGVARGNPRLRANAAISVDNIGKPFDGKYTITTSRHRYDPLTGYTTAFVVSGRQERSLFGLTSGGGTRTGPSGVVIAQVSDVNDPQKEGRVTLTYPWLSETYVSDWARTVQVGAGKDRGAMVVPEVGDEVLVAFEQGDVRRPYVLGGLFNGVDTPNPGGGAVVDAGSGAINRRSMVSRKGHRVDLLDQSGKAEGVSIATSDGKLKISLDVTGTKVTVHADGTVLVEGTQGVTVDAGSSKLDLKGGQIAVSATNGVTIDGGGGAVQVTAGTQLALKGAMASLEGSGQTEVKGGALCTVQAAMVKIN
jgi:phage protein D